MEPRRSGRQHRPPSRFDDFVMELERSVAEIEAEISVLSAQIEQSSATPSVGVAAGQVSGLPSPSVGTGAAAVDDNSRAPNVPSSDFGGAHQRVHEEPSSCPVMDDRAQFGYSGGGSGHRQYDGTGQHGYQDYYYYRNPYEAYSQDGSYAPHVRVNGNERGRFEQGVALPNSSGQPSSARYGKLMYLTSINPVKFTGDPADWLDFRRRMQNLFNDDILDDHEKLEFLGEKFLAGEALKCVKGLRGRTFRSTMSRLEERFGHPSLVANSFIKHLVDGGPIKPGDRTGLQDFADLLSSSVETLSNCGGEYLSQAGCTPNLAKILHRLPSYIRQDWEKKVLDIVGNRVAPTLSDLSMFVDKHAKTKNNPFYQSSTSETLVNRGGHGAQGFGHHGKARGGLMSAHADVVHAKMCPVCKKDHAIWVCEVFKKMSNREKISSVRSGNLCYVCLRGNCKSGTCAQKSNSAVACQVCPRAHNRLLACYRKPSTFQSQSQSEQSEANCEQRPADNADSDNLASRTCKPGRVTEYVMNILPVKVCGPKREITTYAMLDSGSKASFIDEKLADSLGLRRGAECKRLIYSVTDRRDMKLCGVSFRIGNIMTGFSTTVKDNSFIMVGHDLTQQLEDSGLNRLKMNMKSYPHLCGVDFPDVEDKRVSILLGLPVMEAHQVMSYRRGNSDEPYAVETKLGFALSGPCGSVPRGLACRVLTMKESLHEGGLCDALNRFLNVDDYGTKYSPSMSLSGLEQKALDSFEKTLCQRPDGHYECGLLWRDPNCSLPSNRTTAEARFRVLQKKFQSDPEYAKMYTEAMNTSVQNGWASLIPQHEVNQCGPRTFYVSHFGVTNPNKPGKVRPVFDLKEKTRGVSLNDALLTGPDVTSSLIGVLLRAREARVGVASDVKSMFNQCYVREEDRDSLRFLWYDDDMNIRDYRMNVHVFGAADSPFVACSMLRRVAQDYGAEYDPDVADAVRSNFYVDDCVMSQPTCDEAIRVASGLRSLLARGGFELVKFVSNDRHVLRAMDEAVLARPEVDLDLEDLPQERALGLKWDLETDSLGFKICNFDKPDTMRGILSTTARVFDPLGYAAPVILQARRIIRECWQRRLDWDEQLPADIASHWIVWRSHLPRLETLRIPRPYFPALDSCRNHGVLELHVFTDASSYATGCAAYLRVDTSNDVHVALVFGKARLLPMKPKLTIPRAELKAAVDGVRMGEMIKTELSVSSNVTYWTDSEICIRYINNEHHRFHVYVANRQSEIREKTSPSQWRFCPGDLNPADYPSRGVNPDDYVSDHRYLLGPAFLRDERKNWPMCTVDPEICGSDPEVKCSVMKTSTVTVDSIDSSNSVIVNLMKSRYSWMTVKRVVARILRLVDAKKRQRASNTSDPSVKLSRMKVDNSETIGISELDRAELAIIRAVQRVFYGEEIQTLESGGTLSKSPLLDLAPFLDDNGILRVGGRLRNAACLGYTTKHPAILPSPRICRLSASIIVESHHRLAHGGQELIMGTIREKYWIIRARVYVREVIHNCGVCRRRNARPLEQLMGDLPTDRLALFQPAFAHTGTDLFGPIMCKDRRSIVKYYGVIFLCLTTTAIHIETVKFLTTDDFIRALMRHVALRGGVETIRSDNGGNYVGAERELRELVELWNTDQIQKEMCVKGVDWKFQVPYASSMSGIWERRVKEAKRHLYALLSKTEPDPDVLRTLLYEVSAILNQAPLCAVSSDPSSYEALTPGHFLFGRPATVLTPVPTEPEMIYKLKWRQVQALADSFWTRFIKEFVPNQQRRRKWKLPKRNLRVDDLVLITDSELPRSRWKLGRISEVIVGNDGLVRSAHVRTSTGVYHRPIQRLALVSSCD